MVYNWRMGSYSREKITETPTLQKIQKNKENDFDKLHGLPPSNRQTKQNKTKKNMKNETTFSKTTHCVVSVTMPPHIVARRSLCIFFSFYVSTCVLLVTTIISRWPSRPQVLFLILLSVCLYCLCYLEKKVDDNWRVAYFFLLSRWRR